MSTSYTYPGQAFAYTLTPLKGWYEEGALDAMVKLSSNVNIGSTGAVAHSGLCVHVTGHVTSPDVYGGVVNGPGIFEVELGCGGFAHGVPMFLWSGSNEPDISNPGVTTGVPVYGNSDYGPPDQVSVFPQVGGQAIPALVATGGYELEVVGVYDGDQAYAVNNGLRAVTSNTDANGGRLTNQGATANTYTSSGATVFGNPAVAAWDTIVGIVSRTEYVTGNKKTGLSFWSVYLPGTR